MSNLTAISPSTRDDGVGQKSEDIENVIVKSVFRPRGHATIGKFPPCACTKVYNVCAQTVSGRGPWANQDCVFMRMLL